MNVTDFKKHLKGLGELIFETPGGLVPAHFHVTEIGLHIKQYVDCGGQMRSEKKASMQLWVADDLDHRLSSEKLIGIVESSELLFGIEMKNENDGTATKKKNEDFLAELDKDRIEKGCEYAVLVSLLEPDSELYNTGIVDVFHRFPKMYVVRPQFFIPIITLLRNAAMNSLKYKSELALVKAQSIDITNLS